jgi:hypothetical protein
LQPQNSKDVPGGLTGGATPVPIPNTEVKPSKADDTAAVRQWESRTLPGYKRPVRLQNLTGLFFITNCSVLKKAVGFISWPFLFHGGEARAAWPISTVAVRAR